MNYLYLKKHNQTKKLYLGWTTNEDIQKYRGSGLHWKRHIKKHGYDVTTVLLGAFSDKNKMKIQGKYYSRLWDVVENPVFLNLKEEDGEGGLFGEESKKKMSRSAKKRVERDGAPAGAWTSEQATEMNKRTWADPEVRKARGESISKSLRGKKRGPQSLQTRMKKSKKMSGNVYGDPQKKSESATGMKWLHHPNGQVTRKKDPQEIQGLLSQGWSFGRGG